MQALKITDVKGCMNQLLLTETFDKLYLAEATIQSMISFVIDGHLMKNFYSEEEWQMFRDRQITCVPYQRVRNICFEMIKGKRVPEYFKFVFLASPQMVEKLIGESESTLTTNDVEALSINLTFKNGELTMTSGSSMRIFTMDKSLDQAWDAWLPRFLSDNTIEWSKLM